MNNEMLIDAFRAIEARQVAMQGGHLPAGKEASERIRGRLQTLSTAADIDEFHCNMKTDWDMLILQALLKRYGLKSYRYRKQRKSTVLIRVSKQFMDDLLWPIYNDVSRLLFEQFKQIAHGLAPAIAPGPYSMAVLEHEHEAGHLCENCQRHVHGAS